MNQRKANILVVEDDPAILNGLSDVLVFNGYGVEGAEDGEKGLAMALSGKYDLVLLDLMLPLLDGFSVCKKIRRKRPVLPIIMLTAKGAEDDVVKGFKFGADDYVSKPFSIRELMMRVEAVLRRSGKSPAQQPFEIKGVVFDALNLKAAHGDKTTELTRREMDIMAYLYQNQHRIVSKKELLSEVWQYKNPDIETRTVDIHLLKLRKKIAGITGSITLFTTVRGEGYRLEP